MCVSACVCGQNHALANVFLARANIIKSVKQSNITIQCLHYALLERLTERVREMTGAHWTDNRAQFSDAVSGV